MVAALADPTMQLVEVAAGRQARTGTDEAAARILELDGERLRFTHPLLGAAVSGGQTPLRRRSLHARLAQRVPTEEERARHLALATAEPSSEIAAALEDAARAASSRGAPTTAAELAEQAHSGSHAAAARADARRRLFLAADIHHTVGDSARATTLLTRARGGRTRRRAGRGARPLAAAQSEPREAQALYEQALAEAQGDDGASRRQSTSGSLSCAGGGSVARYGPRRPRRPGRLRTDDVALRCRALAFHADWQLRAGRGLRRAEMDEARELELGFRKARSRTARPWCSAISCVDGRARGRSGLLPSSARCSGGGATLEARRRRSGGWPSSSGARETGTRPTGTRPAR